MILQQPTTAKRSLWLEFDKARLTQNPFSRSIRLVLDTTVQQQKADVVCLYEHSDPTGVFMLCGRAGQAERRLDSARIEMPAASAAWLLNLDRPGSISGARMDARTANFPEVLLYGLDHLLVMPLRVNGSLIGLLTAGWRSGEAGQSISSIESAASAAAALLLRVREAASALSLAQSIALAEAELADIKIADRSGGSAEALRQHIERVLQGADSASILKRQLDDLQKQLRDRRLLAEAKARLQRLHGMTEEQAYLHLRNASRRQRRQLREIASEVLNRDQM